MSQYGGAGKTVGGGMADGGTSNSAASTSGGGWSNAGGSSNYGNGSKASTKASRGKASKAKQAAAKSKTSTKSLGGGLQSAWSSLKSGFKDAKDSISNFTSSIETALSPTISMHSYKDGESREQISPRSYRNAQLGMFNKMQQRADAGTLTGYSKQVLSDYDNGRYARAGLDALGSLTFGFAPTKIAGRVLGTMASESALGGFGFSQGLNLGGLSKKGGGLGATVGTALGVMSGSPTAMQALSTGGFLAGGYLGNEANANAHQQALGALTPSGQQTAVGQNSHPANAGNVGNGGNSGNGSLVDSNVIEEIPEAVPTSAFDWSQWSHLYTPDTVKRALVAKKVSKDLGNLPRNYYV